MTGADGLGAVGVAVLLAAYALNVTGRVSRDAATYQAMNAVGAGVAAYASYLIGFVPFVVLEGVWCLVSIGALVTSRRA